MADAVVLPSVTASKYFYWPSCELTRPLTASTTDTTAYWSVVPRDQDGVALTGGFLIGVTNRSGKTELMWVAVGSVAANGLSATVVRGIDIMGPDYTAGSSSFVYALESGSPVFCAITPNIQNIVVQTIQGALATGGNQFRIGDQAAGTKTYGIDVGGTFKGILRGDGTTSSFSNDGTTWLTFNDAIAGVAVKVSAADTTAAYLQDKLTSSGGIDFAITSPAGNEKLELTLDLSESGYTAGPFASVISNVSTTATQLNLVPTLVAGPSSNADALHTHALTTVVSLMAYENISIRDAVAKLPIEVELFTQLTAASLTLGAANANARYAIKITPSVTSSTLTTMKFVAAEQVNGTTTLGDLTISIQADSSGAPSGTAITNGTANVITQATQRTWNTTLAERTATWASSPTLTAGTTYWIVFQTASLDPTNYLKLGVNSSYDESFLTFTRSTYDAFAATWGNTVTNATPFFWFNTQVHLLGYAIVPTDASWGGRTWSFFGFATEAITALNFGAIAPDIATLASLVENGLPYYLSETPGQITQTAPSDNEYKENTAPVNYVYQIGEPISSTLFKVRKGAKHIPIRESTQITATTTRQYITWFKPTLVEVYAVGGAASGADGSHSYGYITAGEADASVYVEVGGASAFNAAASTAASLLVDEDGASNGFSGAGGSFSRIGFTYTLTESGTGGVFAILQARG